MRRSLIRAGCLAAAALGAVGPLRRADAVVGADDYTVTALTGLWETPPAGASNMAPAGKDAAFPVALPFTFPLFGEPYATVWITTEGYALAETAASSVKDPSASGAYAFAVASNLSLQSSATLGTLDVTSANDPAEAWRAPANVARTIHQAWKWVTARTTDPVPQVEVWYDATAAATTYHRDDGSTPTYVRASSPTTRTN